MGQDIKAQRAAASLRLPDTELLDCVWYDTGTRTGYARCCITSAAGRVLFEIPFSEIQKDYDRANADARGKDVRSVGPLDIIIQDGAGRRQ